VESCDRLSTCSFFNVKLKELPATAEGFKKRFCCKRDPKCARDMVFRALGSAEKVPTDLFPNEFDRARKIVESEKGNE
jgi:hypothetical protein